MTGESAVDPLKPWEVLAENELFVADRLRLTRETVRLQDGRVIDDYYQMHMGPAAVTAATRRDGLLVLLSMYKHGPRRSGLGFPGGGVEAGEEPLTAARRELCEETGFGGGTWAPLGDYTVHSNQGCGHLHYFTAQNVELVGATTADDLEPHQCFSNPRRGPSGGCRYAVPVARPCLLGCPMAEQPAALIDRGAEPALRRGPAKPTPSIVMYFVRPAPFLRDALASIVARRGDEIEQVVVAGHPGDLLRTLFDLSPRGNAIRVVVDSARLRAITAARQKGLVVIGCGLVEDRLFPRSETSRGYGATAE